LSLLRRRVPTWAHVILSSHPEMAAVNRPWLVSSWNK
jgi:hypothetical protein